MLKCRFTKKFKDFHIKVDFEMDNEVLGLLGESGSGKTVTLKSIAGIITPDDGEIILNGRVLFDSKRKINLKPQDRKVGYLFQDYALFPNFTVRENIEVASLNKDIKKVDQMLHDFHIKHIENKYPAQISGGEKQRTALSRILVNDPEILLFDEPFSAIDSFLKFKVELEVKEVIDNFKKDAIIVTHNKDEAYRFCDSIVAVANGMGDDKENTDELFINPKTIAQAKLIGIENFSKIDYIDEDLIRANERNIDIILNKKPKRNSHNIGIKSGKIKLFDYKKSENSYPINKFELIENIDNIIVIVKQKEDLYNDLNIEVDKNYFKSLNKNNLYYTIDGDDLLFLDR